MPLDLLQLIRKEDDEEDQGDQYERKKDEVKEVGIHLFNPRKGDSGLMALVFHIKGKKVKTKVFRLWAPWPQPLHLISD
jgi:hypothetical protein